MPENITPPRIITVEQDAKGTRLDAYIAKALPELSRARVQQLIDEGQITVDNAPRPAKNRLAGGEKIAVILPPPRSTALQSENIPLDILYEDGDIILINKQRGLAVHPAPGINSGTLVNALLYHCRDLSGIGGAMRPGIVHRLDKDTTGVMVAAKNDLAHRSLAAQIAAKTAQRVYLALVHGAVEEETGKISGAIGRDGRDRQKMAVTAEGKTAVTHFRVIERFGKKFTLLECRLETGRTHQIRVHLAAIGNPVVGDKKYGRRRNNPYDEAISGQALHSARMTLTHPHTGETLTVSAPLPADMERLLAAIRNKTPL